MIIMIKCEVDHSNSKSSRRRPRVARPTRTYSGRGGALRPSWRDRRLLTQQYHLDTLAPVRTMAETTAKYAGGCAMKTVGRLVAQTSGNPSNHLARVGFNESKHAAAIKNDALLMKGLAEIVVDGYGCGTVYINEI
jgi:hypothetical protein